MEQYKIDALDMAGVYITGNVRMADGSLKWVVFVNGVSRGHFNERIDAENHALDLAEDMLCEGPIQSVCDFY